MRWPLVQFTRRFLLALLSLGLALSTPVAAQSRKLGPDTAKSIQEAKLDATFQTTHIDRIALVPLASTTDSKDAVSIISKNLVAQLAQLHPEWKVVPPDELMNFVAASKLDDQFNMFFGDYLASGTVRQDFVDILRGKLQVDAVFVGTITAYGQTGKTGLGGVFGGKSSVVSLEMGLYRATDGRRIWYGKDSITPKDAKDLPHAAEAIGEVFARFVGRRGY
jgi:hypothetical protein